MGKTAVLSNLLSAKKATQLGLFYKFLPTSYSFAKTDSVHGRFSTSSTSVCANASQYSCCPASVQSKSTSVRSWKSDQRWTDALKQLCEHKRVGLLQYGPVFLYAAIPIQQVMKPLLSCSGTVTCRYLHCVSKTNNDVHEICNVYNMMNVRNKHAVFMNFDNMCLNGSCKKCLTLLHNGHRQTFHTYFQNLLQPIDTKLIGSPCSMSLHTLEEYSLENADYNDYLNSLLDEYGAMTEAKLKGENVDHGHFLFLEAVAMTMQELKSAYAELEDLRSMLSGEADKELQTMAKSDVDNLTQHIQSLEEKLVDILVGQEPADKNDIMLEVSAGVGGQEAMLFTAEIFDMYLGYANFKGWTFEVIDYEKNELGGLRRASAQISGTDVYKHLKFEAGVHRVQRVPKTEKSGRVHTSTMTVAVLPQPSQIDISINPKDLQIDTFRASGAGGQHVNKTESAVRITHKPTGTVAECQQDRSQIKNKEKAMKILLSRIYQKQVEEQEAALRKKRKLQVGSAGRSEKIRTYNYSQDRITDHRGPVTFHNVSHFLSGEESMEDLLLTLMTQSRLQVLQAMVDEFLDSQSPKQKK